MAQEDKLKFAGGLRTTDDSTNGVTIVDDSPTEIDWEDWIELTPAQQAAIPKALITNVPGATGTISADLMTKLWENADPTLDFTEQDISLNSADYDFILVLFAHQSGNRMESVIISKGQNSLLNSSQNRTRDFNYTDATHYHVGVGRLDGSTNNSMCIPVAIYGIKKTLTLTFSAIASDVSTSASKCMLSDGVTSVEDVVEANDFSNPTNLFNYSSSNKYTFPSDGYVVVYASTDTTTIAKVSAVIGCAANSYIITLEAMSIARASGNFTNSMFVRKGMTGYATATGNAAANSSAYFYPLY